MTAIRPLLPRAPHPGLGGPIVHLTVTTSTNDRARELARGGAPGGTLVVAEEQTAGRGRQGRRWAAPRGRALTLSVIHRLGEEEQPGAIGLLALASGLAVCEACETVAPVTCLLKWPNDVWIDGRKVAGILIEARPQEGWAVIGLGLNVDVPRDELGPAGLQATATSLRIETGAPVARDAALEALCAGLANRLGQHREGDFDALRRAFGERDALFGRSIRWTGVAGETGAGAATGSAQGVNESGELIVVTDAGERIALEAGEVHLERPDGGDPLQA